jgi:Protein of unknown function (DUF2384)
LLLPFESQEIRELWRKPLPPYSTGSTITGSTIGAPAGLGGATNFSNWAATTHREPSASLAQQGIAPRASAAFSAIEVSGNLWAEQPTKITSKDQTETPRGRITGPVQVIKKIAEDWALSTDELATLLNYDTRNASEDLLAGIISLRDPDREDRARLMYAIYRILSTLFVDNPTRQSHWLRCQDPVLRNRTPLEVMLNDRIPGMVVVKNLVDRIAGR